MGAVSLLEGVRFQRPKSLKRYYEFVKLGANQFEGNDLWCEGVNEFVNLKESLKTILIGKLRTVEGVEFKKLKM
jgi:coproporphyrinogen III oxidase-like Fe-S oxidoreductase